MVKCLSFYFRDISSSGVGKGASGAGTSKQQNPGSGPAHQDTDVNYSCPICFDTLTEPFMTKEYFSSKSSQLLIFLINNIFLQYTNLILSIKTGSNQPCKVKTSKDGCRMVVNAQQNKTWPIDI